MEAAKRVFITGISRGLGLGFAKVFLEKGYAVYGLSRNPPDFSHPHLHFQRCDLAKLEEIPQTLSSLLEPKEWDYWILNAAVLGEVKDMHETSIEELKTIIDINLWSNKVIIDWMIDHAYQVKTIMAISSGASVSGNRGWNGYAISKAALNMMVQLYAHELRNTKIYSIAPGLIDTYMQEYIYTKADAEKFPTIAWLKSKRYTDEMPQPVEAARRILALFPKIETHPSGQYLDVRHL